MDRTQQLEAIEKLVGYSGLEQRKAREYLEKSGWNVDIANRMFNAHKLSQTQSLDNQKTNRYSEPVVMQHSVGYARPITSYPLRDNFGSAMFGMGPAIVDSLHPSYCEQHLPTFSVEKHKERVIPIQIEVKPLVQKQPAACSSTPIVQSDGVTRNSHCSDTMTKSQLYPVHIIGNHFQTNNTVSEMTTSHQTEKADDNVKDENLEESTPCGLNNNKLLPLPSATSSMLGNNSPKILKRGISRISQNASLVAEERKNVLHDIVEDCHDKMYVQTFVLPDVSEYTDEFREFLEKDLIETLTLVSLEHSGRLNWWAELGVCQRLLPMATSGDGNCLLHAASLAMWGIHDRQLLLRKTLYDTLTKKYYRKALYRRWRWQQTQANKQAGLIFSEEEWKSEWENVLRLASTTPRTVARNGSCESPDTQPSSMSSSKELETDPCIVYESLEEFHVFVLAHVIQRPIIVVADTMLHDTSGEAMAPIPFGGIYLPLECEASHCYRSPLLLTYYAAHFSALVPVDSSTEDKNRLPVCIPIVSAERNILPLQFVSDPGINYNWEEDKADFSISEDSKLDLLKQYLDLEKLPICVSYSDSNSDKNSVGSCESDDGLMEKGKKKDKVAQQMYSVSKHVGGFRKSVGKKLKKLGKGNKEKKDIHKLLGNSSKALLCAAEQRTIWCCKINVTKSKTHQKMIDNYLSDAGERFKLETDSQHLRKKGLLPVSRKCSDPCRTLCITPGCQHYGLAETSYLCSKCYEEQKKHLQDKDNNRDKLQENASDYKHNGTIQENAKFGKSKFYNMDDTNGVTNKQVPYITSIPIHYETAVPDNNCNINLANNMQVQTGTYTVNMCNRSHSPDYDDVQYGPAEKHNKSKMPSQITSIPQNSSTCIENERAEGCKCLNQECKFYGSKETANFCSGCYKNKNYVDINCV